MKPTPIQPFNNAEDTAEADDLAIQEAMAGAVGEKAPAYPHVAAVSKTAQVQFHGVAVWDVYHLAAVQAVYAQAATTTTLVTLAARIDALLTDMLRRRKAALGE